MAWVITKKWFHLHQSRHNFIGIVMTNLNFSRVTCGICLVFFMQGANAKWFEYQQIIMGTQTAVELFASKQSRAKQCSDAVFSELKRIDALMSPYIKKSELAKINRLAADQPVKISQELFDLIQSSIEFSILTHGAFDITYASVGYLYDYRNKHHPSTKQIQQHLTGISYKNILLNKPQLSISFSHKNTKIDLGGIAKGYAVDNSIKILKTCGIQNALVSAGGDSRILGNKNGRPWVMGVQHPRDKSKIVARIALSDEAISTSGDYQRFFIEGKKRYHHILKPSTGLPADDSWSVSVLAKKSLTTDALSTALFVMGTKKAMALVNSLENTEAIVIDAHGKMFYSHGLMSASTH